MLDIINYSLTKEPYKKDIEQMYATIEELRQEIGTANDQYFKTDFTVTSENSNGIFKAGDVIPANTYFEDVIKGMLFKSILPTVNISMNTNSIYPKGATVTSNIKFSIVPQGTETITFKNAILYINGTQVKTYTSPTVNTEYVYSTTITSDTVIQIIVNLTDDIGIVKTIESKKLYCYFRNFCYFGVSTEITNNLYTSVLEEKSYHTLPKTYAFDTESDKYIYMVIPKSLASEIVCITFGLLGRIEKVQEYDIVNSYNNTETYYVYRSENYGLENVVVTIVK